MVIGHQISVSCVKYKILTIENMHMNVFWHVMTCSLVETKRCFGKTRCQHLYFSLLETKAALFSGISIKSLQDAQTDGKILHVELT